VAKATYILSRRSGVSLGVPSVLTRRWNVATAVLIRKTPDATACDAPPGRRGAPRAGPASRSWKLILSPPDREASPAAGWNSSTANRVRARPGGGARCGLGNWGVPEFSRSWEGKRGGGKGSGGGVGKVVALVCLVLASGPSQVDAGLALWWFRG
jgi:hypothetical protein